MSERYSPGELFVYVNGNRWELGMVKRPNNDHSGYFCYYSRGDTAANTPTTHMHKLANAGFTHIEQLIWIHRRSGGKAMTNTDYKSMPRQRGCKTEIRVISGSRMWSYYTPESSDRIASYVSQTLPIVAQDKDGHFAYINTSEAPAIVVRDL